MKVLFVSDIYYPHVGGVSEHIYHLANEFEKIGNHVSILTSNMDGKFRPDEDRVIRVGDSMIIRSNRSHSRIAYRVSKSALSRIVNKFDIIHIHGIIGPTLPILTLMVSRRINILTFHPTFDYSHLLKIFKGYLKRYFKRIDGKIAVSKTARDSIEKYFPGDYKIIPNGVDIKRFKQGNPTVGLTNEILFVGRIEPRKGLQYLINALPIVKKEIPEIKLTVAGGGYKGMRLYIPEEVKDLIQFLGFVEPDKLPEIFRRANIFVSPATYGESFGIVLIEAMASGIPVIASDIPGYRCVIEHGKNGLLVPPRDPEEIANAIIRVTKNRDLNSYLIKEGLKSAERYSWDKIAKKVLNFYYEVNPSLS